MSEKQYDLTTEAYDGKYERGYGINYQDGHIIELMNTYSNMNWV